jgi:hypothetical protein
LGVFGYSSQNSKFPYAKNTIDAAFSFEDRSGVLNEDLGALRHMAIYQVNCIV